MSKNKLACVLGEEGLFMKKKKEIEIIRYTTMPYLEIFLIEMTTRRPHGHEDLEIGILLEGNVKLFIDNEQYKLAKGDIYIINRYQVHSFSNSNHKNLILAFQIHTSFYRKLNYQLNYLKFNNTVIPSGHLHNSLYQLLTSSANYYFSDSPYKELKCFSILLDAIYQLINSSQYTITSEKEYISAQNNSHRINRITEYIGEHYMERITLDDIASLENISTFHASHFIKKMLGISFQEYLNNIRFEHALQLINNTSLNIIDICLETGFSSSKYLNQAFVKNLGCTVKEYVKSKEKPRFNDLALPTDNIQRRYSYEKSSDLIKELFINI